MSKIDPAVADDIRGLLDRPSFKLLTAEMERRAAEDAARIGRLLLVQAKPVDQRLIDYTRGYWKGVMFALKTYPADADKAWQRHVAETLKESETSGS